MSAESASSIATYFRVCDGARILYADTGGNSETTVLPDAAHGFLFQYRDEFAADVHAFLSGAS